MRCARPCLLAAVAVSLIGQVSFAKPVTPPKSFVHNVRHRDDLEARGMAPVDVAGAISLTGKDHADIPLVPAASAWGIALLTGLLELARRWAARRA